MTFLIGENKIDNKNYYKFEKFIISIRLTLE